MKYMLILTPEELGKDEILQCYDKSCINVINKAEKKITKTTSKISILVIRCKIFKTRFC